MGVFAPEIWKKRTALRLHSRSASTKKVDTAYTAYYNSRTDDNALALWQALEAYLEQHGHNWDLCERDKASGGLMRYMHSYLHRAVANRLPPPLVRTRQEQLLLAGRNALANVDIPHSRYGVLYLFGNMHVDTDYFKVIMEGVGEVGGKFAHIYGDGYPVSEFMGRKIGSKEYITAGATVVAKAPKLRDTFGLRGKYKAGGQEVKGTSIKMHTVRTTKGADKWDYGTHWNRTNRALNKRDGHGRTYNTLRIAGSAVVDTLNNIRIVIRNALKNLVEYIRSKLVGKGREIAGATGKLVQCLIEHVLKAVLKEAAPVVGIVKDLAGGVTKTFMAAKESVGAWYQRRQIALNPGHPELAAQTIEHTMRMGMFEGFIDLLKGSARIAASTFLPGLHLLINAIMAGVEFIVRFLIRHFEVKRIAAWLEEARGHYEAEKALALKKAKAAELAEVGRRLAREPDMRNIDTIGAKHLEPELDPTKGGIIHNLDEFKAFYQRGCDASPLIPILTLNTGICGSLMVMLAMFADTHQPRLVSQEKFDVGGAYFARLKEYGKSYMGKAGIDFQSARNDIRQYIEHAKAHHGKAASNVDVAVSFVTGVISR